MTMTEKEKKITNINTPAIPYGDMSIDEFFQKIYDAFEELGQYRAIGTVEELHALKEKNEPTEPEFMHNRSDIVSVWKCQCGNIFQTKHKEGILDGTDVNYCCKCGQKFDWE